MDRGFLKNRYIKIEATFFIIYFYAFRILTDLEYNFWEKKSSGVTSEDFQYTFVWGTFSLISFWFLYKALSYCISRKSVKLFVVTIILFFIGYNFWIKGTYWLTAQLPFISEAIRERSLSLYNRQALMYSIAYLFREIIAICALLYFVYSLKQREQLQQLKKEQLISELTYLKSQLQPHFFFNTLNNIYGLALAGAKETAPMIAKLADIMRYVLYHSEKEKVVLANEISFLENYVDIEKMRHYQHVQINMKVKAENKDKLIAPLLLLPFVENAFKHGVAEAMSAAFVDITLIDEEEALYFLVRNSKPLQVSQAQEGGIGLENVKKRLALLYPGKHELTITDENNSFEVNLVLK